MSNCQERSNDAYITIGEREYIIYEGKIIEDEEAEKIYTSYVELVA
jgi:ABC-type lipopolysaccharide export system ATPase subunit